MLRSVLLKRLTMKDIIKSGSKLQLQAALYHGTYMKKVVRMKDYIEYCEQEKNKEEAVTNDTSDFKPLQTNR